LSVMRAIEFENSNRMGSSVMDAPEGALNNFYWFEYHILVSRLIPGERRVKWLIRILRRRRIGIGARQAHEFAVSK
jgi:hypothetical protein